MYSYGVNTSEAYCIIAQWNSYATVNNGTVLKNNAHTQNQQTQNQKQTNKQTKQQFDSGR